MSHISNDNEPASAGRNQFADANVICTYTRDDGIRDGVFVDVTEAALAAGFQLVEFVDLTVGVFDALESRFDADEVPRHDHASRGVATVIVLQIWGKAINAKARELKADLLRTGRFDGNPNIIEIFCPILNRKIWTARTSNEAGKGGIVFMLPDEY